MSKNDKLGGVKADVLKEASKIGKEAKANGISVGADAKATPQKESMAINSNKAKQGEKQR